MELQGRYWWWPVVLVLVHFGMNGCFGCWEQERIALLELKASIVNYTDEYYFPHWDSADKESDCCEWEKVKCDITTSCVIKLALNNTIYWSGESGGGWYFNASLYLPFEELQYLDLSSNFIPGWIPNEGFERFFMLGKLEVLHLGDNSFNNSILQSFSGTIASLKELHLESNSLNGSIHIQDFKAFNNLEELYLGGNYINDFVKMEGRRRPQVSLEEFSFLEKVCRKAKPDERTWAKLVNPKTIHWYCDGPEPTRETIAYDERIHKQMDDAKRRAMIKSLAVEQKKTGEIVVPSVPGSSGKRKQPPKSDRPHKQPKVSMEPIVGLMAEGPKAVNQVKQGAGKGLMHAPPVSEEKPPPLLRDDSKFALEKLTSILSAEDYEDLGNHSTEAMGETGLFAVGQSLVMMKGLMDRCLNREAALERVRSKLGKTEEELSQLHKWKSTMEQKFELSENTRKELEQKTEEAGKVLKSRADEVKDLKKKLRHAKDDAVSEYRNSESLLKELGGSFLQGFDDALRQIKKTYPDLDVSMITLTDQDQTSALPVASENTEDLFGEEAAQGDGESALPNEVAVADPKKAE